jgi:carbonic anhydrase/acetyltransferase-like protein (isoleucine patch superfamily)
VQDNCIFHICLFAPTIVGDDVTIGHGAIIHGCTIGDRCIIGMGAVVMDGAQVGHDCIIGAGAVVSKNAVIPANSIVMGLPGKVRRELTQDELDYNVESAASYVAEAQAFTEAGLFWRGSDVPADNPMIRLKKQS